MPAVLSSDEITKLRRSGKILAAALEETVSFVKAGISTEALNDIAEKALRREGATPSFKNYFIKGSGRFPSALCVSINSELVHGIPSSKRVLKQGDIVSLDLGANYQGIFSDMAKTVAVMKATAEDQKMIFVTNKALNLAVSSINPARTTGDIGNIIEKYVASEGFVVIKNLVGHGIGKAPHEDPQIPNFGKPGEGVKFQENCAYAIEPMVAIKNNKIITAPDHWTIKMKNGGNCAHFEQTILVTNDGAELISKI
ncbi:MAG: methionyl aminopeptidase [Candidatus Berkelbacteria bacterium Athens1014_28]|uniref:Methionine aminopeptidase n=1 Tax=Candidatus Berkelbacteria bacterium Athens1014_28 TaxID=2017145 RepID=A0A554LR05_9BACT|nr:MAG: methionyl aminopeptidase [Candidatus Berkelbacteria bacterium Athens1014_28]